jgi:hypothetical protein
MDLAETPMPADRRRLVKRVREYLQLTHDEALRAQMWRLGQFVSDRDCPTNIADQCRPLYGLVGEALKAKLNALLPLLESRVARNRKSRDRIDAISVSKSMLQHDAVREFYFAMSEADLQTIWNNGENDLPTNERELVRVALRNKMGIGHMGSLPQVCSQCFVPKDNCVCERGWW